MNGLEIRMEHESLREKIAKLLRLSESPNEHEAQLALLYAQRLMAEHKLSMRDFTSKKVQVTQKYTGISFSKRGNIWIFSLSGVLAKNYCCKLLLAHISHKQLIYSGREYTGCQNWPCLQLLPDRIIAEIQYSSEWDLQCW